MGSGGSSDAKKKGTAATASEEKYKPDENVGTESMDLGATSQKPRRLKKAATRARLEERSHSPRPPDPPAESVTPTTEVRPCDSCGEMRKTTNFSRGEESQWLCAACQLTNGGLAFGARQKQKRLTAAQTLKPQPVFRRQGSGAFDRSKLSSGGSDNDHDEGASPSRARRRGRCKTNNQDTGDTGLRVVEESEDGAPARRAKLTRASTANLGGKLKEKEPSVRQGFAETKLDVIDTSPKNHLSKKVLEKPAESDAESQKVPPLPQRTLPGGFTVGERAVTLISRESQNQSLMMELGQEGNIVGAVERRLGGEVDLRLLVQFPKGVNWWLSPAQLSQPAQFGAARAAGIYGFSWGARVRSLVTLLKPQMAQQHQELWLGDEGTVIGPSAVKGKIAVRFDNCIGDWSIWPCLICKTEVYSDAMQEKIHGFARGDRVRSLSQIFGARSFDETRLAIAEKEEGTVIGPGHSNGKVLVHFDADERIWSLNPKQLEAAS